MKSSPQDDRIRANMAPGVLSRDGFLGHDKRPLSEIMQADEAVVGDMGLTHQAIARRLDEVLQDAMAGYGSPVQVGPNLTATWIEAMGRIPCPFAGGHVFPKGQVELVDRQTGRAYCFTPLTVHMIGEHGFYQGLGSQYRLDPREIVALLGIRED